MLMKLYDRKVDGDCSVYIKVNKKTESNPKIMAETFNSFL